MYRLLSFLFMMYATLHAQTTLSGNIGGMVFESTGNPFIVGNSITVQENKTTTIKPGCIFYFKPFTGVTIDGSLNVIGNADNPVVFTSFNDDTTNDNSELPNPFDWNGIQIRADAGKIRMGYLTVAYSVYGIKSFKTDLYLSNCIFKQNGQSNFTIKDRVMPVAESIPYSYSLSLQAEETSFVVTMKKMTIPVLLSTTGIISGIGGVYFFNRKNKLYSDYNKTVNQLDFNRIRKDNSETLTRVAICCAASALCITSATALFTTGAVKERKKRGNTANIGVWLKPAAVHLTADW